MKRVLLVDDLNLILEINKQFFEHLGIRLRELGVSVEFDILLALSVVEAIENIENAEEPFDLIVSDRNMPLRDYRTGLDLLKWLRERGDDTTFILYCSPPTNDDQRLLTKYGAHFLAKPTRLGEYQQAILTALDFDPNIV